MSGVLCCSFLLNKTDANSLLEQFLTARHQQWKDYHMPGFRTEVPHPLSKDEATEKLKAFLDKVRERYKDQVSAIDGSWADNILNFSLTTFGFTIKGVLTVDDKQAVLEGDLPFAALAFKGKIEQGIKSELEKALA